MSAIATKKASLAVVLYNRKSTDREEMQQNSLEHQRKNCENTANQRNFTIIERISESASAKEEYKRKGFNRLVTLCKTGKVAYIIIDEPKRLSRNTIDASRVIDLMDKKLISGIIATSREYHSDNPRDKFLLLLDLGLSKMDNEDRSSDIKAKMLSCAQNGKFLAKAPFGYENFTIKKGSKDIRIVEEEAEYVRQVFLLRCKKKTYAEIAQYLNSKGISTKGGKQWIQQSVLNMIKNKVYYGIQVFAGVEYIINTDH